MGLWAEIRVASPKPVARVLPLGKPGPAEKSALRDRPAEKRRARMRQRDDEIDRMLKGKQK